MCQYFATGLQGLCWKNGRLDGKLRNKAVHILELQHACLALLRLASWPGRYEYMIIIWIRMLNVDRLCTAIWVTPSKSLESTVPEAIMYAKLVHIVWESWRTWEMTKCHWTSARVDIWSTLGWPGACKDLWCEFGAEAFGPWGRKGLY